MINRHNYEEFFLLYVDNELAPEERSAVEIFMQQNPDLAAEMEMLQQATLHGDPIKFEQKELLYNQAEGVTLDNYEEYFLLSVDKELTGKETGEVEKFVLQHPKLQNEYVVLQKTKLEPEAIRFEGKKKLYKNQEKERGVLLSPWFRMSVAAAVITLAMMTWIFNNRQGQSIQPLVTAQGAKKIKAVPVNPTPPVNLPGRNEPVVTAPKVPLPAASVETATKVRKKAKEKSTVNDVADNFFKTRTPQTVTPASKSAVVSENPTIKAPLSAPLATAGLGNKNRLPVVG
jgi:anti-sigma factor RsiW